MEQRQHNTPCSKEMRIYASADGSWYNCNVTLTNKSDNMAIDYGFIFTKLRI